MYKILLLLFCVASGGPPLPSLSNAVSKRATTVLKSPRIQTQSDSSNIKMLLIIAPQLVTNYFEWHQDILVVTDYNNQKIPLDYPIWVWVDRQNPTNGIFTNGWNGPMPSSHTIDFISIAPKGALPKYRFTTSFQNNTNN